MDRGEKDAATRGMEEAVGPARAPADSDPPAPHGVGEREPIAPRGGASEADPGRPCSDVERDASAAPAVVAATGKRKRGAAREATVIARNGSDVATHVMYYVGQLQSERGDANAREAWGYEEDDDGRQRLRFRPAPGEWAVPHGGAELRVTVRVREDAVVPGPDGEAIPYWDVAVCSPAGDARALDAFVEEARRRWHRRTDSDRVARRHWSSTGWSQPARRPVRPFGTVFLPRGVAEELEADALAWEASRDAHRAFGFPHKRAYVLCGGPGSGKSVVALALACLLRRDLCSFCPAEGGAGDEELLRAASELDGRCALLLDDVDCALAEGRLTAPALARVLDGGDLAEGAVVLLTTARQDRVPACLLRPGRVDVRVHLPDAADEHQARRMLLHHFPERCRDGDPDTEAAARELARRRLSPSLIMAFLFRHRSAPDILADVASACSGDRAAFGSLEPRCAVDGPSSTHMWG